MKSKRIIKLAICGVIIVIAIIVIILIFINKNQEVDENFLASPSVDDSQLELESSIKNVTVKNNYFVVKNCVENFYNYYSNIDIGNNSKALYGILDKKYINYKDITLKNTKSKLSNIQQIDSKNREINITSMCVSQQNENISVYLVKGDLIDIENDKAYDFSIIVNVDMLNRTYSILLEDYINENFEKIDIDDEINFNVGEQIEENEYNTFAFKFTSDDTYVTEMLKNYKNMMLYHTEQAYNCLDEQCKNERFTTLQDFEKYVNEEKDNIKNLTLYICKVSKEDGYTKYIAKLINGSYYTFKENGILDYKVILDDNIYEF